MKVRIEVLVAVAAMACASFAIDVPYPSEKLAAFVVEKLDVTSLS